MKPLAERVSQPTPGQVVGARRAAKLTQAEAALLVTPAAGERPERTWQNYEAAEGTKAHRAIPLPTWELFLLMTGQHPSHLVAEKPASAARSG